MQVVRLASETDFAGWRAAARGLRLRRVRPDDVLWTVDGDAALVAETLREPDAAQARPFKAPRAFVELASAAILHRCDDRFALLYRILWRLEREPYVLRVADADGDQARDYARGVTKAIHKMKASVRLRQVADIEAHGGEAYAAWFEPAHRVTEVVAPFFMGRFANMRFSLLTPDACAHWDLERLVFTPGADPADAPNEDGLEAYWRTYYASIFSPARLKVGGMEKDMPKRYWRNPPQAALIPEFIASAEIRTTAMVAHAPSTPSRRVMRAALRHSRDAPYDGQAVNTLEEVMAGVDVCRRCDLWRDATQGVSGEGAAHARLMFVGEQPGDQEDLAGRPFVGPAGQMFDRALAEAGVPRDQTYVTNAVKHFKHELRGKRRIHKTPNTGEVTACRWWLDSERRIIRPRVIVALGATAGLAVTGKPIAVAKSRQQALQLDNQEQGVITYHPSFLLRVPDAETKARAYAEFVADLKFAWKLAG